MNTWVIARRNSDSLTFRAFCRHSEPLKIVKPQKPPVIGCVIWHSRHVTGPSCRPWSEHSQQWNTDWDWGSMPSPCKCRLLSNCRRWVKLEYEKIKRQNLAVVMHVCSQFRGFSTCRLHISRTIDRTQTGKDDLRTVTHWFRVLWHDFNRIGFHCFQKSNWV